MKTEHRWIDAFKLWCWGRLLRVSWTTRRSNQSILKEINPEYSLEGLMLKLKLQCFGHLMGWADSLGKTLMLGMIEGKRRRGWQRMRWLHGITDSIDMSLNKLWEVVKHREVWQVAVHGVTKSRAWLSDWIGTTGEISVCTTYGSIMLMLTWFSFFFLFDLKQSESQLVYNSLWNCGLYSSWNSPGQNTGVGSCSLLQGIFSTQGSIPALPHCRWFFTSWTTKEAQEYWSG